MAALLAVAGAARADGPHAMQVGADVRKMTREVCAQKAIEAMGVKEKFTFAEIMPDGNVRGWNDKTSMLVLIAQTPNKENVAFVVIAAGVADEAARLRDAIRTHIADGPHDPKVPARFAPEGAKVPPSPAPLCWKTQRRAGTNLLRFFDSAATVVLEKRGFTTNTSGKSLVFGGMPDRAVAMFLSPSPSALEVQFHVVAIIQDEDTGNRLAADLLGRIIDVLYEP
jgi:hypothetical protein